MQSSTWRMAWSSSQTNNLRSAQLSEALCTHGSAELGWLEVRDLKLELCSTGYGV